MFIAKYITGYNQLHERKLFTKSEKYTDKVAREYAKLTGYPLYTLEEVDETKRTDRSA